MKKYCLILLFVSVFSNVCISQSIDTTKVSVKSQTGRKYMKPGQFDDGIRTATLKEV